jgi:hypothetical protein
MLAAAVAMSPFLGGAFALIYGVSALIQTVAYRRPVGRTLASHALAAIPAILAVAWCMGNDMLEGAGGALVVGFRGNARNAPILTLALALGPLLISALLGLWMNRRRWHTVGPLLAAPTVAILLFYFVSIGGTDPVWVGWRAGQILLVTLPALGALWIAAAWDRHPRLLGAVLVLLFAVGVPTTAIDLYNAQDISNREMGPGFPWSVVVTPDQRAEFDWIRIYTPPHAVVQMEPTVRGRATWTLIPSFAQRRMAAGLPISLVMTSEYQRRAQRVRELYGTGDARHAWEIARDMGIDYLYVDKVERGAFGDEAMRKFDTNPQYFRPMFQQADVAIYAVGD